MDQAEFAQEVAEEFIQHAGWRDGGEEELRSLEEEIEQTRAHLELLESRRNTFENREEIAVAAAKQLVQVLGPAAKAGRATIIEMLCVQCGIEPPGAKPKPAPKPAPTPEPKPEADPKPTKTKGEGMATDLAADLVEAHLDAEGKTLGQIMKDIDDPEIDKDLVRKAIKALMEEDRAGSEGERRGKKYFLIDQDA